MRTELSRIATIQTGLTGGARALVALIEYAKPDGSALTTEEIDGVLTAAVDAAAERGAVAVWRASTAQVEPVATAEGEELALETVLTVVKVAPDVAPLDALGGDGDDDGGDASNEEPQSAPEPEGGPA